MRFLMLALLSFSSLFAVAETLNSFSADFEQRITDEKNSTISYKGHVWAKRPDQAHWNYQSPVNKSVYIKGERVVVIEPDLEQAIIKKIEGDINLLAVLSSAVPLGGERYRADYGSQTFFITMQSGVIAKIQYRDAFDNLVELIFMRQEQNGPIAAERFDAVVPESFDILSE
jgi:outer membrane lipoprotein carrier protein